MVCRSAAHRRSRALLTAGAGLVLSGIGTPISGSAGTSPGIAWATRNPNAPWGVT